MTACVCTQTYEQYKIWTVETCLLLCRYKFALKSQLGFVPVVHVFWTSVEAVVMKVFFADQAEVILQLPSGCTMFHSTKSRFITCSEHWAERATFTWVIEIPYRGHF